MPGKSFSAKSNSENRKKGSSDALPEAAFPIVSAYSPGNHTKAEKNRLKAEKIIKSVTFFLNLRLKKRSFSDLCATLYRTKYPTENSPAI